jgi:hypothetical protein
MKRACVSPQALFIVFTDFVSAKLHTSFVDSGIPNPPNPEKKVQSQADACRSVRIGI